MNQQEPPQEKIHSVIELFANRKKQEAIDAFKQAIIINPFDVSFYNNLAAAYGKNKQYKEAMNILKKALVIDKNNKTTLNFMKITLEKLKG